VHDEDGQKENNTFFTENVTRIETTKFFAITGRAMTIGKKQNKIHSIQRVLRQHRTQEKNTFTFLFR